MGYLDEHALHYERSLVLKDAQAFLAEADNMPRLTRAAIPAAVRSAAYILDIDAVEVPSIGIPSLLQKFGYN